MKITIQQFNQIARVSQEETNPVERDIAIYKILYPETLDTEIETMPIIDFYEKLDVMPSMSAPKVKEFTLQGQLCTLKQEKISVKAMMHILAAMQADSTSYLHHVLYHLYSHSLQLEDFLNAPLEYAMPWVLEFKTKWG